MPEMVPGRFSNNFTLPASPFLTLSYRPLEHIFFFKTNYNWNRQCKIPHSEMSQEVESSKQSFNGLNGTFIVWLLHKVLSESEYHSYLFIQNL